MSANSIVGKKNFKRLTVGIQSIRPLVIGNTTATVDGIIRYTGSDFEGRKSGSWVSLTSVGGGSLFTDGGGTTYLTSLTDKLVIGATTAGSNSFLVKSNDPMGISSSTPGYGSVNLIPYQPGGAANNYDRIQGTQGGYLGFLGSNANRAVLVNPSGNITFTINGTATDLSKSLYIHGDMALDTGSYYAGGIQGVSATVSNPTSITVTGGIITAIS